MVFVQSPVIALKGSYEPLSLELPVPEGKTEGLLCLKFEGYTKAVACGHAVSMGMRLMRII